MATKYWGPLGWMTLHSVSLIYPDTPTAEERAIMDKFIRLFAETISCPTCKDHFQRLLSLYTANHPEYLNSKQDLAVFVFRAHNSVNRKLDKPRQATVAECLETLKLNTKHTTFSHFRKAYITYLINNWKRELSGYGTIIKRSAMELQKINNEYFNLREIDISTIVLQEADVLDFIDKQEVRVSRTLFTGNVGFKGGKLKLAGR